MNWYFKVIFLFVLVFLCTAWNAYGQELKKKFKDKKNNYIIRYPKTWDRDEEKGVLILTSPKEGNDDSYRENIHFKVEQLDASGYELKLTDFTELMRQKITARYNLKFIEREGYIRMAGQKAYFFGYSLIKNAIEGTPVGITFYQVWTLKDKKAYVFTFAGETSAYYRFKNERKAILDSFEFME